MTTDAQRAEQLYVESLATGSAANDWHIAVRQSRASVADALRASRCLTDIEGAITSKGEHLRVFRHMLAPPISQDQFALLCPAYRKQAEKPKCVVSPNAAPVVSDTIRTLLDTTTTRWLSEARKPTIREIRQILGAIAPMLSQQVVATVRRGRMSMAQEISVIAMLEGMGWSRMSTGIVNQSSALPALHFMHKTRFATKTRPQEVDIACGLGGSFVLAMECKVTNDRTNSVKRINDVLKKATAWQDHWGSFVRTAALLQGVIADKDVARLKAANVHVFWSHDLPRFKAWLESEVKA